MLLLATSSLTFGGAKPIDDHAAAAAAATGATTTGLRKTVRKLRSEQKSSTNGALMEQSYGFSQTKAKVLEQQRKAKGMVPETAKAPKTNQSKEPQRILKKSKTSKDKNMKKKDKKKRRKKKKTKSSPPPQETATIEDVLIAAPASKSQEDVEEEIRVEVLDSSPSGRRNLQEDEAEDISVTVGCAVSYCNLIFIPPAELPNSVSCYVCVITLIMDAGTGIDVDEEATAIIELIDTGVFAADLDFVVAFAGGTASPSASPTPTTALPDSPSSAPSGAASEIPFQSYALETDVVHNVLVAAPNTKSIVEVALEIEIEAENVLQENNIYLQSEVCGEGISVNVRQFCVILDCASIFILPAVTPDFVTCKNCTIVLDVLLIPDRTPSLVDAKNILKTNINDGTFTKDLEFLVVLAGASDLTYVPTASPTTPSSIP